MEVVTIIIIVVCVGFCFCLCGGYVFYKRFQTLMEKKRLQESRKNWKLKHRNTLTGNFVMTYHMAVDEMYQFRDQSLLGKGSYGVVVVGVHKETKVEYAIKLVNTETGKRHRIEREYKLLKDIDHPNIVRLFAVYDTPREVEIFPPLESSFFPHPTLPLSSSSSSSFSGEFCDGIVHWRSSREPLRSHRSQWNSNSSRVSISINCSSTSLCCGAHAWSRDLPS
jgi:hypothetical protein